MEGPMSRLIRLSKSCLSDLEKQAVMRVLDAEFLGMGSEVQQFEQALTAFFGRPAVCVVNGTAALHLALQACDIGIGDEVLVQSHTYVASFQAISATGATPVACDVDPQNLCFDWRSAEKRITEKTKAIMPVHFSGGVGDLEGIYAFASRHGLRVIEDAAHAFGTVSKGRRVGSFGEVACFSFDGIKNITSGEGGCIVTNDLEILRRVRDTRLLAVEKDTEKRFSGQRSWEFDVVQQGWRYHMSNIMAAIGLVQLHRFSELAAKRQLLALRYDKRLSNQQDIRLLKHDYTEVVPHIYVVQLPQHLDRKALQSALLDQGIQTGVHYQPNHALSFYTGSLPKPGLLSETERIAGHILTLPLHPDLSESDIDFICDQLLDRLNEG
jgi:dTDP-4-amino-4,6-dideoxygalactose transaminase